MTSLSKAIGQGLLSEAISPVSNLLNDCVSDLAAIRCRLRGLDVPPQLEKQVLNGPVHERDREVASDLPEVRGHVSGREWQ